MLKKILLILVIISLVGCVTDKNINDSNDDNNVDIHETQSDFNKLLGLSSEEISYIDDLRSNGELRVAAREVTFVYEVSNGTKKGFHYEMIEKFTSMMELKLEIVPVIFKEFWSIDGEVPDEVKSVENFMYTPDMMKEVNIYTDNLTALPWREKLVKFIIIHPTREVSIYRNDREINELADLDNLRVAITREASAVLTLEKIAEDEGFSFDFEYVEKSNDRISYVEKGLADFTVIDINRAIVEIEGYDELSVGIPISEMRYIGWAVGKDDELLSSILTKYFSYIKETGEFDLIWSKYYPIDFIEYMRLISN